MTSLRLLLISLALAHLIAASHAVPSTSDHLLLIPTPVVFSELNLSPSRLMQVINEDEEAKIQRMDIEINDYPGSGANDRHTPKPPE
ncbi:unnamed protein product [Musa acuminata subsp. burmannicoides]|uniref:(wild Malaysian banana) hypothetical protein n=1 Tax=Musa acuminata subsp. malaccensis TaxID=214687 RepID=A0A8D7B8K3_MUSAM|nr:unnamed protein product [Musa acuminata subsp. malaccensis]